MQTAGEDPLSALGIESTPLVLTRVDRLLLRSRWRGWQRRLRLLGPLEKQLVERGCDLVYFVRQSELPGLLQRLNYVTTLFDLCHRDTPEFPEVREFGEFQAREHHFNTHLTSATLILADSAALAAAATRRYGVDAERMLAMPYTPATFLDARTSSETPAVVQKYGLAEGYLFYPAQFWAHKNHARILEALALLAQSGQRPQVVFCGSDKGNLRHVEQLAAHHGLREQVRFLGFVPGADLRGLYDGCAAVVMPTYFGPTNLPALEAWMIGKPLVYSTFCAEQAGDAALCVDPDSAEDLARALREVLNPAIAATLVARGRARLQQVERQRAEAEAELLRRLVQFDARRRCWA
jgi:glycosyltransferase involved in cell wall biosynthesis